MIHTFLKHFSNFQNFGHVTNDVIMGSYDQHSKKIFCLKYSQNDFRKSREGIRPYVKGFASGIVKLYRGGLLGPPPGLVGLSV